MFLFDIVLEINMEEVCNVMENVNCELLICFDFCGVEVSFEYKDKIVVMVVQVEFQF